MLRISIILVRVGVSILKGLSNMYKRINFLIPFTLLAGCASPYSSLPQSEATISNVIREIKTPGSVSVSFDYSIDNFSNNPGLY